MSADDPAYERFEYLRESEQPHTMCPGCGGGTVMNAFVTAFEKLDVPRRDLLLVSGIGCSAWIPSPNIEADTLHTTHGRPIAYATGAKSANEDLETVVISGDGDLAGIGGNHLLHAARRNVDVTAILVNNFTYGMTGGQVAPTTPHGSTTTTSPYGNPEDAMDVSAVVEEAGASFVARQPTSRPHQLVSAIERAIEVDGFSLVEVISQCPTVYGRRNDLRSAPEMLSWMEEQIEEGEMTVGTFVDRDDREEYVESLVEVSETAKATHERAGREPDAGTDESRPSVKMRIAGEGGQGVVVAGSILGEAATLEGRNTFKTEEYGSRARGGVANSDLIVSDDAIYEAKVPDGSADVLVALTDDALTDHRSVLASDGTLHVDEEGVSREAITQAGFDTEAGDEHNSGDSRVEVVEVPFLRLARDAGNERAGNAVVLGYLNETYDIATTDSLHDALEMHLDTMLDVNREAIELGRSYAR